MDEVLTFIIRLRLLEQTQGLLMVGMLLLSFWTITVLAGT
jgi:hypothetical protein